MNTSTNISKFPLGRINFTPAARDCVPDDEATEALHRHRCGDWGELDEETHAQNDESLTRCGYGSYVLSQYRTSRGQEFFVFTSGDRFETAVFLAGEMPIHLVPEMFDLPWTNRPMPGDLADDRREVQNTETVPSTESPKGQNE